MRSVPSRMSWLVLLLLGSVVILSGCFQVAGQPLPPTATPMGGIAPPPTNTPVPPPTDVPSPTVARPTVARPTVAPPTVAAPQAGLESPTSVIPPTNIIPPTEAPILAPPTQVAALPTSSPFAPAGVGGGPTVDAVAVAESTLIAEATRLAAGAQAQFSSPTPFGGAPAPTLAPLASPQPFGVMSPTPFLGPEDNALAMTATQVIVEATQTQGAILTATATALGTFAPTATPMPGTPTATLDTSQDCVHVVRPGENLYRISLRYGVPAEEVVSQNGLANPRLLSVGQELVIPRCGNVGVTPSPGVTPPPGGQTHVVRPGENLFRIALRYGVTVAALANANNIANINLIGVGDVLVIP